MPCLIGCLALSAPRFAIVLVVLFSDYIGRAFTTGLWPFLGFLFMPVTTLVVLAALIDLGMIGGSASRRRRTRSDV
jgi:hypothetical protein